VILLESLTKYIHAEIVSMFCSVPIEFVLYLCFYTDAVKFNLGVITYRACQKK